MTVETRPTTEPRVKTVPDVLRHAARYIEEFGWSDDLTLCDDGRRCTGSAISFVATGKGWESEDPLVDAAATALIRHIERKPPIWFPMGAVANWNDDEASSAAEVIAALRAAADAAERAA